MASTIGLQYPHLDLPQEPEKAPKRRFGAGLLDRVKQVGQNLRNTSREDVAWIGAAVGAGLLAKLGTVAGLAAIGISTGGTAYAALGVAAAGGAVVGLTKNIVKNIRSAREGKDKLSTTEFLKSTGSSIAISVATLGYADLFELAAGESFGHFLGRTFSHVTETLGDKMAQAISASKSFAGIKQQAMSDALISPMVPQTQTVYEAFKDITPEPSAPVVETEVTPEPAPEVVAKAPVVEQAAPAKQPVAKPPVLAPHPGIDNDVRSRAMEWVKKMNPTNAFKAATDAAPAPSAPVVAAAVETPVELPASPSTEQVINLADVSNMNVNQVDPNNITIRTETGVEIKMPKAPDLAAELNIVREALKDAALETQVRDDFSAFFPDEEIPENATVADLAERIHPENPTAYLSEVTQTSAKAFAESDAAKSLDPSKMAGACVGNLPANEEALDQMGGRVPNTCVTSKEIMEPGDYVLVRDGAEANPSARKGLRALFGQMVQKTSDFIGHAVSNETIPDMAAEKMSMALK